MIIQSITSQSLAFTNLLLTITNLSHFSIFSIVYLHCNLPIINTDIILIIVDLDLKNKSYSKNFTLLFSVLLLWFHTQLFSQPCLSEGITFTTQEQIDSFQINYPSCTEIEGDVGIYGDDITNLNGLNVLTSIGDLVSITVITLQI